MLPLYKKLPTSRKPAMEGLGRSRTILVLVFLIFPGIANPKLITSLIKFNIPKHRKGIFNNGESIQK